MPKSTMGGDLYTDLIGGVTNLGRIGGVDLRGQGKISMGSGLPPRMILHRSLDAGGGDAAYSHHLLIISAYLHGDFIAEDDRPRLVASRKNNGGMVIALFTKACAGVFQVFYFFIFYNPELEFSTSRTAKTRG